MKKIMFNDEFVLTQAVLDGRKTMTRRLVGNRMTEADIVAYLRGYPEVAFEHAPYQIGEVVAIAQSYKSIGYDIAALGNHAGWNNKLYVCADFMPHQIRITGIKVERLQDISDEDCLKEGIGKNEIGFPAVFYLFYNEQSLWNGFPSARRAFVALIDKVSGKGTWESNPWVFVYEFELLKGGNK